MFRSRYNEMLTPTQKMNDILDIFKEVPTRYTFVYIWPTDVDELDHFPFLTKDSLVTTWIF